MDNIGTTKTDSKDLSLLIETSGIEAPKQTEVMESLGIFFKKAKEWDSMVETIVITSPDDVGKMKMAREGRLSLRAMRLEAEGIVSAKRDSVKYAMANYTLEDKLWLKAGQMMEATFKNLEARLEEKEKFAERWEAEQKAKVRAERVAELLPLDFDSSISPDLANMDEATYSALKRGLGLAKKEREEAIIKENADRLAKEKADIEAKEKLEKENTELKAKAEADRKAMEKVQAELKAKAEAEKQAELDARAKAKTDSEASDSTKLDTLVNTIASLQMPEVSSVEAKKITLHTKELLTKVADYIKTNATKI